MWTLMRTLTVWIASAMPMATLISVTLIAMPAAEGLSPAEPAQRQLQGSRDGSAGLFLAVESQRDGLIAPSGGSLVPSASGISTVRSRLARIAADQLAHARTVIESGTPARLTLNFFDDAAFQVILEETLITWTGGYSLLGRLEGIEYGTVALVVRGRVVSGTLRTSGGTYEVEAMEDGVHVIRQIDLSTLPVLGDDALPVPVPVPVLEDGPLSSAASSSAYDIDVMVLYTPQAAKNLGRSRMIDKIERSVADANLGLRQSRIWHRFRLLFVEETGYFSERANSELTLDALAANATVRTLRDLYSADLVHVIVHRDLLTRKGKRICGQAYVDGYTGLTKASCLSPNLTFVHELGHNMGLNHDPYQNRNTKPPVTAAYSGGQGYVHIGSSAFRSWRTIMAYDAECQYHFRKTCYWAARFSDPYGFYRNYKAGSADSNSVSILNTTGERKASLRLSSRACAHNLKNIFDLERRGQHTAVNGWYTCRSRLRSTSYSKYYSFALTETRTLTIDLESRRTGGDAYLYIHNGGPYGSIVHRDDDSGPGRDARIEMVVPRGKAYTIEATTWRGGQNDEFELRVRTWR